MPTVPLPELPDLQTWIGHEPESSVAPNTVALYDPNTEDVVALSACSSPQQVDRAIQLAHRTHLAGRWHAMGVEGRTDVLSEMADRLDTMCEHVATLDALNSGVPIRQTRLFAASLGDTVRAAVRHALAVGDSERVPAGDRDVFVHRIPWGVTALLLPWNAPAAVAVKKLAYALAAGATVVMKPSPASPFSAQRVMAAVAAAGIPHGVVSLVLGGEAVGRRLASDTRVRAISMTGSTTAGRHVAAAGAARFARMRLELGSNNAAIVREDADIASAAAQLVLGATKLSGQWCEAPRRVIVDASRLHALVDAMASECARLKLGSSLDDTTDIGPMAFEARRSELIGQRQSLVAQGARIIEVGSLPPRGWFFAPTLAVADAPSIGAEIFGPLLTVQASRSDVHALELANAGQVGLASYVFSADVERAAGLGARLCAGEVKINGTSVLDMSPNSIQSFFGDAGLGGHGDADLLDFHVGRRIVGTDAPGLPL